MKGHTPPEWTAWLVVLVGALALAAALLAVTADSGQSPVDMIKGAGTVDEAKKETSQ